MKKQAKIAMCLIGFTLAGVVLFVGSLTIGSRIAIASIEKVRASIEVGMGRPEVLSVLGKYDGVTAQDASIEIIQINQVSRNVSSLIVGSWFCFFKVKMDDDKVRSVDSVFCVD